MPGQKQLAKLLGVSGKTVKATRRLIRLEHRRIVFLDSLHDTVEPGHLGSAFLDELTDHGINSGINLFSNSKWY